MISDSRALLIDITRCIGCRACVEACQTAHGLKVNPDAPDLSPASLTVILEKGELYVRRLCMHCQTPSCASACPVAALRKTPEGPVVYEASRCLGCRYCIQACPFNVPRYEWDKAVPAVAKCDFCAARQAQGQLPACAEACPVEATVAGSRSQLVAEARRRIAESPGTYHPQIYGEEEVGGTSVLLLSPVPLDQLGFPAGLPRSPLPELTHAALKKIPDIVTVGGAFLLGVWWITKRREEVARAEGRLSPLPTSEQASVADPAEEEEVQDAH